LLLRLFIASIAVIIHVSDAPHLEIGLTFIEASEIYYQASPEAFFGFATRYGPDEYAMDEFYRLAQEAQSQQQRGYIALGGGYGYFGDYLIENRASPGYAIMASATTRHETIAQRRLLELAQMERSEYIDHMHSSYVGIVSLHSPNDIGREFCLLSTSGEKIGLVIVGGTAARNDWTYYGPSVNDDYGHPRIGVRELAHEGLLYHWAADLSDGVYEALGGRGQAVCIVLAPTITCEHKTELIISD